MLRPCASDVLGRAIDCLVGQVREHWHIPAVTLAVVQRAGPLYICAYGKKDCTSSAVADADTAFAIASCSKAFTSTLAVALEDDGILSLDDPIRRFIPEFQLYDPCISARFTIRDGLSNRSGLSTAGLSEYGSDLSRSEVLRRAREVQPKWQFRDRYTYSNIGFIAVAEAISVAAGRPFAVLMEDRIFRPLGMRGSSADDDPWGTRPNIAGPHREIDGASCAIRPPPLANLLGAGTHTTSAHDAAVWLRFHLNEGGHEGHQVVREGSLRETYALQTPRRDRTDFDGYGLGWQVRRETGNCLNFHDGTIDGFRATMWFDREEDCAVFVSVNCGGHAADTAISRYLRQVFRGDKPTDWLAYFDEKKSQMHRQRQLRIERDRSDDPDRDVTFCTW